MTKCLEQQPPCEDNIGQFLQEVRAIPRLTPQQEQELASRCADGDEEAIRQMVSANLRLVVSVAREYAGRGVPLLDLIQEGSIGLLAAARKFDHSLDCRFSTYATKWIRQGISKYLINHAGMIRVPEHTAERMRKLELACAALRQESGEEPTTAEIAEKCDMPEEKVIQLMQLSPEVCSLDVSAGDGSLGNLIADFQSDQPQEAFVRGELERIMEELLAMLDPRQKQILQLHFGMEDGICHSLEEISKEFGISKERTRQIERQAMERLQKMGASMGLEEFLNE